jgi:hypothetical protein
MSPDFGYYVRQIEFARFAHSFPGTVVVCVPTGLLVLSAFYLLRQPLCFILPQPHRGALTPFASVRPSFHPQAILTAAVSVLIGSWTHIGWDAFTHNGAWAVSRIAFLREPLFRIGGTDFPGYYILQQLSTFGGSVLLLAAYLLWLQRQRRASPTSPASFSERGRYLVLATIAAIALIVAIPPAIRAASLFDGYHAFRVLVFRTGVYATAVFTPLLALTSVVLFAKTRNA